MAKKGNIVRYRERLDKTLASPDLTNDHILKTLVQSQLLRSSNSESEILGHEEKEKLVETKTEEVSKFLDMLRSASVDNSGGSSTSSHADWKLKQDNEEFRVMYREGPEGTPFHTLLVEGYIDGPVDVCLCLSWEPSLYKKWWPHYNVPTFKVIASECLQKVQIGEQIALVRMKLSWPLSSREVIVHYYVFEYFQDDLVVVLLNSVPELRNINGTNNGFNSDVIPEAKDIVRIDLVGGYAMQKVTSKRSYFRTIANMDIKLDFVPPSLINFISRQLIGSGFRLYQKAVTSMMSRDEEFSKALGEPMYVRIREALYTNSGSKAVDPDELKQVPNIPAEEQLTLRNQEGAKSNQYENSCNVEILDASSEEIVQIEENVNKVHGNPIEEGESTIALKDKRNGEIVEEDSEEIVQIEKDAKKEHEIPIEEDDTRSILKSKRNVYIRSDVRKGLETLEWAISVVREYGFKKGGILDSYSAKPVQLRSKNEVSIEVLSNNVQKDASEGKPETNSEIQSFRHTGINPNLKEVNYNKVVPASASPQQNISRPIEESQLESNPLKNGTTLNQITICDNNQLNSDGIQDMSSDDRKKYRYYCCFLR